MRRVLLCALLLLALQGTTAAQDEQKKVLVLVGDEGLKESHSQFFGALEKHGFSLDIQHYKEKGLKLKDYDQWLYQHLVLFAPKALGGWRAGMGAVLAVPPTTTNSPAHCAACTAAPCSTGLGVESVSMRQCSPIIGLI